MQLLKDKVAIITGGGRGLGAEACRLFAEHGAKVVVADLNMENAKAVAHEINGFAVEVNVANRESVDRMVEAVIAKYGKIDILVNNAGITMDSTLKKMKQEQWQTVIDVNLTGVFNVTQAVVPHMLEQGYGRIINTSSVVRDGNFGQSNYVATKAGVVGLTKVWSRELGRKGINVNAVAPGFIATDMVAKMPEKAIQAVVERIPLGHLGKPKDIANAYLYLASPMADYVNGTVLEVNGGYTV